MLEQELLQEYKQQLESLGKGNKTDLINKLANVLDCSPRTAQRKLKAIGYENAKRKERSDKGTTSQDTAILPILASALHNGKRLNGKKVLDLTVARSILETNGLDFNVSNSRLSNLLKQAGLYKLPVVKSNVRMQSLHPNHVHQVDPSLALLYFAPNGKIKVISDGEAYKNKPFLEDLKCLKLWRYVLVDHYSGSICVKYYQCKGENIENMWDFLGFCWGKKSNPLYYFRGVPKMLVWDKGSANTSKAISKALGKINVETYEHQAGNPRAKGMVENANNLVEKGFESRFKFTKITSVEELNKHVSNWCAGFNANMLPNYNSELRRAKTSRSHLFNQILSDQLVNPPLELWNSLLIGKIEKRKVGSDLTISFKHPRLKESSYYDVSNVCNIGVGMMVDVSPNYMGNIGEIIAELVSLDGEYIKAILEPIIFNKAGFRVDSPVWGQGFTKNKATTAEHQADHLDAMAGLDITKQKTGKEVLFNSAIDPFKGLDQIKETKIIQVVKKGVNVKGFDQSTKELEPMAFMELVLLVKDKLNNDYPDNGYEVLKILYPNSATADQLNEVCNQVSNYIAPKAKIINL